MSSHPSKFHWN
ncbi:hypothetical protein RLOC_00001772 [Lonchura striata]|uniref:Uncharacterized protein n=1 Tax=Lonchura striata TaxID=40157 RepID=A0A218UII7_9PASE|nr:hypothetical protein RLOC_00001772 [Lonchura striata domestica]